MTRRLIAAGIALVVSIPLIPVLNKAIEHLTGNRASMIFPARGWTSEESRKLLRESPSAGSDSFVILDESGSMARAPSYDKSAALNLFFDQLRSKVIAVDMDHGGGDFNGDGTMWAGLKWEKGAGEAKYDWDHQHLKDFQLPNGVLALPPAARISVESGQTATMKYGFAARAQSSRSATATTPAVPSPSLSLTSPADNGPSQTPIVSGGTASYTWKAGLIPGASWLTLNSPAAPQLVVTTPSLDFTASPAPMDFHLTGGALPAGLSLSSGFVQGTINYQFSYDKQVQSPGLYYLRARYYDPSTGRFIARDSSLRPLSAANNAGDSQNTPAKAVKSSAQAFVIPCFPIATPQTGCANPTAITVAPFGTASFAAGDQVSLSVPFRKNFSTSLARPAIYDVALTGGNGTVSGAPDPFSKPQKNVDDAQRNDVLRVAAKTHRVANTGWYALEVAKDSAQHAAVEVEFIPDNMAKPEVHTLKNSGNGKEQAAWMHFREPGSLIVRASGNEKATIRGMDGREFLARASDITLQKGLLTVSVLVDGLQLIAFIVVVFIIEGIAYWLIGKLPRAVQQRAKEQITLMFTVAKWATIVCYTVWTAKDILAGIGIRIG
jgi:RHS repeat-associated protein